MPSHKCPKCGNTKVLTNTKGAYECTNCNHKWSKASEDRARRVQIRHENWGKRQKTSPVQVERPRIDFKTVINDIPKFLFYVIPPLTLWLVFGHKILNYWLAHGLPDGLFRILGFGVGQLFFILLWAPISKFIIWSNWLNFWDGFGCFSVMILATVGLTTYYMINLNVQESSFLDLMFPPRMAAQVKLADVMDVCNGAPLTAASEYSESATGIHPIVIVNSAGGWHELSNTIRKAWQAPSLSKAELVACADPIQETVIQECQYYGSVGRKATVTRVQKSVHLTIFIAKTGVPLIDLTIDGSEPSFCPDEVQSSSTRKGSAPDIGKAIAPYVQK